MVFQYQTQCMQLGTNMSGKGSLKDAFALLSALAFVPAAGLLCTLLFGIEAASRRFGPLGQRLASPLHSLPFEVCNVLCTAMGCLLGGILWTPGTYWRRDHP